MVTSPYEWKILKWDEKTNKTKKQTKGFTMGGIVALQCIIYGIGLQNLVLCLTQKSHTSYIFHISQDWVHS